MPTRASRQGARPNVSPASESKEELRQKRLILEEDERLDEVEEVYQLLADNACCAQIGSVHKMLTLSLSA